MGRLEPLYDILFAVVQLDLWILTASAAPVIYQDSSLFDEEDHERVKRPLPRQEADRWETSFRGSPGQESEVRRYVDQFSIEEALWRIRSLDTLLYIERAIRQIINVRKETKDPLDMLRKSDHTTLNGEWAKKSNQSKANLTSIHKLAAQFRRSTLEASSPDSMDKLSISAVKGRMEAMKIHADTVCRSLLWPRDVLETGEHPWW